MAAHDRIRLTGRLRKAPAEAGAFYLRVESHSEKGKLFDDDGHARGEFLPAVIFVPGARPSPRAPAA